MKTVYAKPEVNFEEFMANEYVAACGTNSVYAFECNAGNGVPGSVYKESNGIPGLQPGRHGDENYGATTFHACGKTHYAPTDDVFAPGYYLRWDLSNGQEEDVMIWEERNKKGDLVSVHATDKIDKDQWEVARS